LGADAGNAADGFELLPQAMVVQRDLLDAGSGGS
jgi:hypothetical protein